MKKKIKCWIYSNPDGTFLSKNEPKDLLKKIEKYLEDINDIKHWYGEYVDYDSYDCPEIIPSDFRVDSSKNLYPEPEQVYITIEKIKK